MPFRASVGIFNPEFKSTDNESRPVTPDAVFEAALRVIENKNCELVRTPVGIYIVSYSELGPFQEKVSDEWMPVYVAKMQKWRSGGIKLSELKEFQNAQPKET